MRPFAPLPASDQQAAATRYLDAVSRHPRIVELRDLALGVVPLSAGDAVLEIGCGLGDVARALALRAGSGGRVVASDHDPAMVAAAELRDAPRADAAGITYRVADVVDLPFESGGFDVVWCERVLQHVSDPASAVRELRRVTAPGGSVCVIDVDWRSLRVGGIAEETSAPVLAAFASIVPGPDTAARVPELLADAGFGPSVVREFTASFASLADASSVIPVFDRSSPLARVAELDTWFDLVEEADRNGTFSVSLSSWITVATVPGEDRAR